MATVDIDDEFYKTTVKPNLDSLTSTLRVDIIQQKLQQEGLITDRDDQVLRLEMKTPIRRATYFLDILQQWDAGSYWKFCKIVWESTASCPAHKKVARLLKLSEASFHNNPALESQGAGEWNYSGLPYGDGICFMTYLHYKIWALTNINFCIQECFAKHPIGH
jgi:hypothetical protein